MVTEETSHHKEQVTVGPRVHPTSAESERQGRGRQPHTQ